MWFRRALLSSCCALLVCLGTARAEAQISDTLKEPYRRPSAIPFPESAPYAPQMATLGKMLFFDPRLSGKQNLSCASCHNPSFGFEVPVPGAIGATNKPLPRKAPTVLNAAWTPVLFWDGRAPDLETQAAGPITADAEMDGKFPEIVARLKATPEYAAWFGRLFPRDGVTQANILTAIATYERTIVSGWAPFDRWIEGDATAISPAAQRGFALFTGKAACASCHSGWNFTDNKFHDLGIPTRDIGRAAFEPDNPLAKHAFKTPGLRNLTYRAPFGHAGQFPDLEAIVAFYETGGLARPSKSPLMKPISLTGEERADLLAFLRSLTAEQTRTALPNLPN
ncbi:cytochrome-c peroxidase [Methylobacterium gregans]|uniref:Methylamine utilization protein MauG n=1 Tax=Methylobacterium gregans TaxID=374424 RepID=A0AA37HK83_9HYPH|nr:cytochrome c peroxidase [Methylobacterium gregans]MDQ0519712.1 cytochrome c peroxidase [Methylobacterium gregans]GJD76871.1 Cytochrome c551 peroxidase [Methylobacterium gregans]GLS56164.1 cytochrome-c peroxidase [Methylobacterium gregans]